MITYKKAGIEDIETLLYWDKKSHVINSDPNDDWNWVNELPRNLPWRWQFIAILHKKPIGFIQIIDAFKEETNYWNCKEPHVMAIDIWIGEENNLGKGYGTQMMNFAIEFCFKNNMVNKIWVDPLFENKKAHKFYEKLGFKFLQNRWFNNDYCRVYELCKTIS